MDHKQNTYITQPNLPPLEDFVAYLEEIWDSRWLTNNGKYHQMLEEELCRFLGVDYCNLFTNGTLALMTALQALRITGEVITTPYSFVATTHSLFWNGITPVFCDIDKDSFNINPDKIEELITPKTTAILPVHVYGNPCDVEKITKIADTYGLKVIYDAAHAFGVKINGNSVLQFGDLSVLSFHATKVFNTFEGGAIICHDAKMKKRIDYLKNFGFADETTVIAPGINAKMNEFQAALGLLQLKSFKTENEKRKKIFDKYITGLSGVRGISLPRETSNFELNYSYFPILVDKDNYGITRDELYEELKRHTIYTRRYFYPLISQFPTYRGLPSSAPGNLSSALKISEQILCLPIYSNLEEEKVSFITELLQKFGN